MARTRTHAEVARGIALALGHLEHDIEVAIVDWDSTGIQVLHTDWWRVMSLWRVGSTVVERDDGTAVHATQLYGHVRVWCEMPARRRRAC